ncbi:MAG: serine/threonine protein kinase [Gammaproteobacteria bacterium]|nr:serine/threonine protein kinase [Gammaproteobacteria bacterium]
MDDFKAAVKAFVDNKADAGTLVKALEQDLEKAPRASARLQSVIDSLRDTGKLPAEVHERLSLKIREVIAKTRLASPRTSHKTDGRRRTGAPPKAPLVTQASIVANRSVWQKPEQWGTDGDAALEAGTVIKDNYRLESPLGEGGMGVVWKATNLAMEDGEVDESKFVAIKFLSRDFKQHPDAVKTLVREFNRYKDLGHPNIVKAYDIGRISGTIFIVMEFLDGVPLDTFIKKHPQGVSLKEAESIIKGMAYALAYAHEGTMTHARATQIEARKKKVVHLDFKPGNVFYHEQTQIAKVIDFGISRYVEESDRNLTTYDVGELGAITEAYASPQMIAEMPPEPRDDIYGLACIAYELLTGKHPFEGKKADKAQHEKLTPARVAGLKKDEWQTLKLGLAFDRNERIPTAYAFADGLYPPKKPVPWAKIGGVAALAAVVGAGFYFYPQLMGKKGKEEIISAISACNIEGVRKIDLLDNNTQLDILRAHDGKLVKCFLNEPDTDVIGRLETFSAPVRENLFSSKQVETLLVTHYNAKIKTAIERNDFSEAENLFKKAGVYITSRELHDTNYIRKKRRVRLKGRINAYRTCRDNPEPLLEQSECLRKSREQIAALEPGHALLRDERLSERYDKAADEAIQQKGYTKAENLLRVWREFSKDSRALQTRQQELDNSRRIDTMITGLSSGDTETISRVLAELSEQRIDFRAKVLAGKSEQQAILNYYQAETEKQAAKGDYSNAFAMLVKGREVLPAYPDVIAKLDELEKLVSGGKKELMASLQSDYKKAANACADAEEIRRLQDLIRGLETDAPLYPGLAKYCENRTRILYKAEDYTSEQTVLAVWETLQPDAGAAQRGQLNEEMRKAANDAKVRIDLEKQLRIGISQKDDTLVDGALTKGGGLDKRDREKFRNHVKNEVIRYYIERSKSEEAKDDFSKALALIERGQAEYRRDRKLRKRKKNLNSLKKKRLGKLQKAYRQALLELDVQKLKYIHARTEIIAPKHRLLNHPGLARAFSNALHSALKNLDHAQIETFLNDFQGKTAEIDPERSLLDYAGLDRTFAAATDKALNTKNYEHTDTLLRYWLALPALEIEKYKETKGKLEQAKLADKTVIDTIGQITAAIEGDTPAMLDDVLLNAKQKLSEADLQRVFDNMEGSYVTYYLGKAETALQEKEFVSAAEIISGALAIYPNSKGLQQGLAGVETRQRKYINELMSQFETYVKAGLPADQDGFAVLAKIEGFEPGYVLRRKKKLYDTLHAQVVKTAKREDSVPIVDKLMSDWENVFSMQGIDGQEQKILEKVKKRLALHYFGAGRKSKGPKARGYFEFCAKLAPSGKIKQMCLKKIQ